MVPTQQLDGFAGLSRSANLEEPFEVGVVFEHLVERSTGLASSSWSSELE